MKMQKTTQKQIVTEIDEQTTAVEIIRNHENPKECSVIINNKMFSIGYETEYTFELLTAIKTAVPEEAIVIMFNDNELPEAWKQSYLNGGITEDRFDRRTEFNAYNEMNEMFCISRDLLWDINDKWVGTPYENNCEWKTGIIKWYKNHLI